MSEEITLAYDGEQKRAVLTFPGGRQLRIANVTEDQANAFRDKHAGEFHRRDCRFTTAGVIQTREGGTNG